MVKVVPGGIIYGFTGFFILLRASPLKCGLIIVI